MEAGQNLIDIVKTTGKDGEDDLLITLDRSKIPTVGKEAIGNFLRKLQVKKDYITTKQLIMFFDHYFLGLQIDWKH